MPPRYIIFWLVSGDDPKHRQTRGGKSQVKKKKELEHKISISRASRGRKKFVTVITGLSTYGIDLKVAAKFFGQKFATGSSVTGADEIVIQGDIKDDLFDVLTEKWKEVTFRWRCLVALYRFCRRFPRIRSKILAMPSVDLRGRFNIYPIGVAFSMYWFWICDFIDWFRLDFIDWCTVRDNERVSLVGFMRYRFEWMFG